MATYTIYTYGSGFIETPIIQAIASFAAGSDFTTLIKVISAVGMLIFFMRVLAWGTQKVNHLSYIKYMVGMMVIYTAMFMVKCNVVVEDTVVNAPTNAVVVNNVPWGIGAVLGTFSGLTYELTNDIENAFSTPQTIDYTQAGMGFSLTSQQWATGSTIQSPSLYRNFDQYVSNCVLPGVSTGNLPINTVNNSTDLLTDWAAYTEGSGANLITTWFSETGGVSAAADGGTAYPAGTTTTCSQEAAWIQTAMAYYVQQDLGPQESGMLDMTWTQYQSLLGNVNSGVYGISQSSTQYLMQATAANQFGVAMLDLAKMSGVNANGLAYGTALAQSTQTSQFTMSGILAGRYMPVVYGIMFAIFTGASLLLLLLMLLPHPMQYIKMYFELLLWLTIWPALMAIYNFIVDVIIQWQASGYFSNYSGTLNGVAITNIHVVSNWIQTSLAWVGYLSWSIPMLSYAIVSGSAMAMTSMVGSMDSAVGAGVSSGASEVGKGDVDFGNTSARNMHVEDVSGFNRSWNTDKENMLTANKIKGDPEYQSGNVSRFEINGGKGVGVATGMQSIPHPGTIEAQSQTGASVGMLGNKFVSANAPAVSGSVDRIAGTMAGTKYSSSLSKSVGTINSDLSSLNGQHGFSFDETRKRSASLAARATWGKNWRHDTKATTWYQSVIDGGIGLATPQGSPVKASVSASGQAGYRRETATDHAKIAEANAAYIRDIATQQGVGGSLAWTSSSGEANALNKSLAAGMSTVNDYSKAVKTDRGITANAMPAYLNSRLGNSGLAGMAKAVAGLKIENSMGTTSGVKSFDKFLNGYNLMPGVGSSPAKIKRNYSVNARKATGSYSNLSPSTNPSKIKAEILKMQHLAKDSSNPGRGLESNVSLKNAEQAYKVDKGYASYYKKHGNSKAAAIFKGLEGKEAASIKKIEQQRKIEKYTFGGTTNTAPKNTVAPKVKSEIPDDK